MEVTNLILQLKSKVTANTSDQQLISKAIRQLELGTVETVSSFADLPSADISAGELYYVFADSLYWSTGGVWVSIAISNYSPALAWGAEGGGRLGNNDAIANRSSPIYVVGGFTDWCQVSGGRDHSLGLRTNGTLWAWGNNGQGRLGDNTTTTRSSPVSVVGGFTDWCQVSAGYVHNLGVRINGSAWAWGNNLVGRIGDGTTTSRPSPVSVVGGFTDWCQVSAGGFHSLGVRTNGTAWAWGNNGVGRLGDNTTTQRTSPVSVVGGFTDWCQVSAGSFHSLGVRTNGTAWAWGCNGFGRLGDNTTTNRSSPVSVVGGFTNWCQMSAGEAHSLGVRTNGTAWAWGANVCGRLGDGTVTQRSSPVSVVGGFTDWCQVSAGDRGGGHSLGVRTNGTAWAWGANGYGRLGDGTVTQRSSPVSVVGGFTDWCQVSGGNAHSLAVRNAST